MTRQLAAFWPSPDEDGDQLDLIEAAAEAQTPEEPPSVAEDGCEWCAVPEAPRRAECAPDCGCPDCESQRALDDDADAWAGR